MPLNDKLIKSLKPEANEYKKADGGGLYLLVKPNGGKYWRLKFRANGKEKKLAIGVYPQISLAEAREKANIAKKQVTEGQDPSYNKKLEKIKKLAASENNFESVARAWHSNKLGTWTPRHAEYVIKRLEADIFPQIGFRPINEITAPELLAVIRIVENRGAIDIAKRLLQTSGQIFRYAIISGLATRDVSIDLKGALRTRKKENYSRLAEDELPEFLSKLESYDGALETKLGLKLLILTMVRTGELRGAKWDEINFEKSEWHIAPERMKMKRKHIVPLSKQALQIFKQLKEQNDLYGLVTDYVFPNKNNANKFMSENTLLYALYRMGYHSRTTGHGFRGMASTILNEHGFNADHIEVQLAHADKNQIRAAYNHALYLPQRKTMLQWWADFIDAKGNLKTGNKIVSITKK